MKHIISSFPRQIITIIACYLLVTISIQGDEITFSNLYSIASFGTLNRTYNIKNERRIMSTH